MISYKAKTKRANLWSHKSWFDGELFAVDRQMALGSRDLTTVTGSEKRDHFALKQKFSLRSHIYQKTIVATVFKLGVADIARNSRGILCPTRFWHGRNERSR